MSTTYGGGYRTLERGLTIAVAVIVAVILAIVLGDAYLGAVDHELDRLDPTTTPSTVTPPP